MWIAEFAFGMVLGYYVVNKYFRNFVNCLIFPQKQETTARKREAAKTEKPEVKPLSIVRQSDRAYLEVTEEQINDWIAKNPDLKRVNEVTK